MAETLQVEAAARPLGRLSLKQAVAIALQHFVEVFPELAGLDARVMLEEVEDTDRFYLITIGYDLRISPLPGNLAAIIGTPAERRYKTVTIDAETGRVSSIKIRSI